MTEEQRRHWRQRASWLAQLGLSPEDDAPIEIIEEVANATLALLDQVERRDVAPRTLPHVIPGVCFVCGGCAHGFRSGSGYWHTHQTNCTGASTGGGGRLIEDAAIRQLSDRLDEAQRLSRWLYDNLGADARSDIGDVGEWPWLVGETSVAKPPPVDMEAVAENQAVLRRILGDLGLPPDPDQ